LKHNATSVFGACALLCAGCAGRPPAPEPSADQCHIVGAGAAIRLTMDDLPVDQVQPESEELSLATAVQRALASSPEIQSALARARAAWADAHQARLLPNPVLNVAIRFPDGGGDSVIEAGLSEDLVALLTLPRRASSADRRVRAATADVLAAVLDVIHQTQDAYFSAQAADAELVVLEDRMRLSQRLHEVARARVQAGESGQLDALSVQADRAALDVELLEKSAERRHRRLALARRIGVPSGAADWTLPPWSPQPVRVGSERDYIAAALARRPEIQAGEWELAALGDDLRLARAGAFEGSELGVDAERESDWSIGPAVSVPIPIFDWGQARRQKAHAQVVEARHRLTQTRRQVVQDVRQALESLTAAQQSLTSAQDQLVPLQQRRRELAEAAYRNGAADITSVLLAEQQASETRSKLTALQQRVLSARAAVDRAVGGARVVAAITPATTQASE
jgi:outer membrane protein TolC